MALYAEGTQVTVESTHSDIRRMLRTAGADRETFGWIDDTTQFVGFRWRGKMYRFDVPVADRKPEERRRWRVLYGLLLKPLFKLAEEDHDLAESALLAHQILPSGEFVKDAVKLIEQGPRIIPLSERIG